MQYYHFLWFWTWSLTVREEHRLRVFENRVLRKIFGPRRDQVTGVWKKLHNKELHHLNTSSSIIRNGKWMRMWWAGYVAVMKKRNSFGLLVGKLEGNRPLGKPRRGWMNNIKMNLGERVCGGKKRIDPAQNRDQWRPLLDTLMYLRVL
jgi:hypothetical protein